MAAPVAGIRFFTEGTPGPYSRVQTTINEVVTTIPDTLPFVRGGASASGGDLFYFMNEASAEPVTARVLSTAAPDSAEASQEVQYQSSDVGDLDILIRAYVTGAGIPGVNQTFGGTWTFTMECQAANYEVNLLAKRIYCKVYKRDNSNVNTLLWTTNVVGVSTTKGFVSITTPASAGSIVTTDRIFIEVYGSFVQLD